MAERTKELAGKALEALDVPEQPETNPSAPPTPSPGLEKLESTLLEGLVEALTGLPATNPEESAEVLITQLRLVRANRGLEGSLVTALSQDAETAQSLMEALESEQAENRSLRKQLANVHQRPDREDEESKELLREEMERTQIELEKTQRMLGKIVREKADLQLMIDNEDKVDARVMRSAFTTLCFQIDNRSVRDGVLRVMAEILQVSPEDRPQEKRKSGLGDEFLQFLNEELSSDSVTN